MEPWKNSEQFGKPINRDALNNFGTRVSNIRGGGEKDNRGREIYKQLIGERGK